MIWSRPSLEPLAAHSPLAVARFIVAEAENRGFALTPMKLLKIAYLAHGWMLGIHGIPLVRGPIEAWQHGPVFPELYDAVKHLGAQEVTLADLPERKTEVFEAEAVEMMKDAVDRYGPLSTAELASLSDATSSPWELTYRKGGRRRRIPIELIKFYYQKMLELHQQSRRAQART